MAKILRSIELPKPMSIPGPTVNVLTVVSHDGTSGHKLTQQEDGSVIVSHPRSKLSLEFPASLIVKKWEEVADLKAVK